MAESSEDNTLREIPNNPSSMEESESFAFGTG